MEGLAILRPDCSMICLEVDDGVCKALGSNSSLEGAPTPEEASQPRDHCQTLSNVCGIISEFAGALCAPHATLIFAILGLSPSVVRMCANE